jgi:hypothetical protein
MNCSVKKKMMINYAKKKSTILNNPTFPFHSTTRLRVIGGGLLLSLVPRLVYYGTVSIDLMV